MLLCMIFVYQGIHHTVLALVLIVFLLDLSLQQFTLVLKEDNCALCDLFKSTLFLG